MAMFGTSRAVTRTYNSGTSATETIPFGVSQLVITAWGGGGGGGLGSSSLGIRGGGGGSGGYTQKTITLSPADWGATLTYTVGSAGASNPSPQAGGATQVQNSTFGSTVLLIADGGGSGSTAGGVTTQGGGGAASGGDTNTSGNGGGNTSDGEGAPNGGGDVTSGSGSAPGGGGTGGRALSSPNNVGDAGAPGRVVFAYT